jgi:hypothetical protein
MIVRCKADADSLVRPEYSPKGWLSNDKEHAVLELIMDFGTGESKVRVAADLNDGMPVILPLAVFDVVSGKIPDNWVVSVYRPNYIDLAPREWGIGFWERYFDDEPDAIKIYHEQVCLIHQADAA